MQKASTNGLVSAPVAEQRCLIECVHGAPENLKQALAEEWSKVTASQAHAKLASADVMVTNMSDKETQLPKIEVLDRIVRTTFTTEWQQWQQPSITTSQELSPGRTAKRAALDDEEFLSELVLELRLKVAEHEHIISTLRTENATLKERLHDSVPVACPVVRSSNSTTKSSRGSKNGAAGSTNPVAVSI